MLYNINYKLRSYTMKKFTFLLSTLALTAVSWQVNAQIFNSGLAISPYGNVNSPGGEDVTKVIDGNVNTKFLDFNEVDGMGFTVDLGGAGAIAQSIEITTANDSPGRDGSNVEILGSNDGTNFTSITTITIPCVSTRYLSRFFNFSNSTSYTYYRINFPSRCGGDSEMQVAEVQLYANQICIPPSNLSATNISTTNADLGWNENGSATSWQIEWGLNGFSQGTGNLMIATNPQNIGTLTASNTYDFYVRAICGPGDTSIWVGPYTFNTPCSTITPSYLQDFNTFVPTCWDVADDGTPGTGPSNFGSSDWYDASYINAGGPSNAVVINLYSTGKEDWLLSPIFDLSAGGWELAITAAVTEYGYTNFINMGSDDTVQVLISTDGGTTWSAIYTWDVNNQPNEFGDSYTIDLSAYTGNNTQFAIWATEGTVNDPEDYEFFINDFEIRVPPTCPAPKNLFATNLTGSSAELGWLEVGSATNWQIEWDVTGFTPGTGNLMFATNTQTINSLTPESTYQFYVRAICGPGDTSVWKGPFTFNTPCATYTPSHLEEFNTFIPTCWEVAGGGTPLTGPTGIGSSDWNSTSYLNAGGIDDAVKVNLYANDDREWLISPNFDLSSGPWELVINAAVTEYDGTAAINMGSDDEVKVLISTNGGTTWSTIYTWNVNNQPNELGDSYSISLSAYTGTNNKFAIWANDGIINDDEDYDFFINDFEIKTPPSCPAPSSLHVTNVSGSSADLAWTENGSATSWQIEWGPTGFTPGTGTLMLATNPQTINPLTPESAYQFYVRAVCTPGDSSIWKGPFTFNTPCASITPYHLEGFDTFLPNCWAVAGSGNPLTGPSSIGSSDWGPTSYLNAGGIDDAVKINLYSDVDREWLISPIFDLSINSWELKINAAVTEYDGTAAINMGSDDTVQVLISTNGGTTWSAIYTWDVNNQPSELGDSVVIDLSAYTGTINKFAIWASDGTINDNEDYDFFINDFEIRQLNTTGLGTNDNNIALNIYPNPNKGLFTLNINTVDVKELNVTVTNLQGQIVYSKNNFNNVNKVNEQIDLSNKAKGVYFINVTSDRAVKTQKIVIQ